MAKATRDIQADDWSVDDAFLYLTDTVAFHADRALFELNQSFARGDLCLHYRHTDSAGLGQEGDVPSTSWTQGMLRVGRDFNRNQADWATGKVTNNNDGRAFVEICVAEKREPGSSYALTVSAQAVQILWPQKAVRRAPTRKTPTDEERVADALATKFTPGEITLDTKPSQAEKKLKPHLHPLPSRAAIRRGLIKWKEKQQESK
jgi:hypothetical protein